MAIGLRRRPLPFFSNIVFLFAAGASRVIQTFFPTLLDGRGGAVSADLQAAVAPAAQAALSISGGLTAFFSSLQDGVAAAAGSSLSIFSGGGGGMGAMGGMDPSGGMGMAGMGMDGMVGGAQPAATSLIGKLVGLFVKTGEDFTLFANTVECGIFVLVCLFFLFYFFGNRKFFFSSLEDFRVRDEAG
ncbi:MAG: hypothetical protein ACLVL7_02560 [Anaerotruncus massiliensis (ex Togo et al. 2019)]